ncbi:hypothetical protein EJ05DRAFT_22451 [Pseudovirgaria hyperparasitica]|uniref:Uncharacterized protein n=1 Tax=Pseudovirgaria hyperparasitica TaxID=470096 RepID=A0A6A6WLU1_9PEZI|nr:uncharacterized protein EJ05DRAFT_22451 [Pseudovirgaria hyperparasitica]KAF2762979.1 hypothetical protein EJ05DRAFT_22451 [Pseudovirgaria hyperparasitica]
MRPQLHPLPMQPQIRLPNPITTHRPPPILPPRHAHPQSPHSQSHAQHACTPFSLKLARQRLAQLPHPGPARAIHSSRYTAARPSVPVKINVPFFDGDGALASWSVASPWSAKKRARGESCANWKALPMYCVMLSVKSACVSCVKGFFGGVFGAVDCYVEL